jgi:hypothetical protein
MIEAEVATDITASTVPRAITTATRTETSATATNDRDTIERRRKSVRGEKGEKEMTKMISHDESARNLHRVTRRTA